MSAAKSNHQIEARLERGEWEKARTLIEQQLSKRPNDHWLITQFGVTLYEQGRYRESLRHFLASLEIVPDCPLTLWNLAGALDAIGKTEQAIQIYVWLLRSKKSAVDDPCWESKSWTDTLKTDCVYRLGLCFHHMEQWKAADRCFRQYVNLLLAGTKGTYSVEDAIRHIRESQAHSRQSVAKELKEVIEATLQDKAIQSIERDWQHLPSFSVEELLAS